MTVARYNDRPCAECGVPFSPSSGRQKFCTLHREPKFQAARNLEAQQRCRARQDDVGRWQVPARLEILGGSVRVETTPGHRVTVTRADRTGWVTDALRLARRLHRAGDEVCARRVVGWAELTAAGQIEIVGCHWLTTLVDSVDYEHARLSSFAPCGPYYPEANDDRVVTLSPAVMPPGMSDPVVLTQHVADPATGFEYVLGDVLARRDLEAMQSGGR